MKFRTYCAAIFLLAGATLWQSGCGSSNVNQEVDTVSPGAATVVADTTQVFTSTVTGPSSNLNSTWTCTYVYTPAPTTSQPNPSQTSAANCTSGMKVNGGSIGTWTTDQTTADNTLSYTAPPLTDFPNPIPTITFTAAAAANTNKKGTAVVTLDTGIRISVSPTSATAPVGITPAQIVPFSALLAAGPPINLNWKVMQPVAGNGQSCTDFPNLTSGAACGTANPNGMSCSPSCGSIDNTGVYTAPATMPTQTSPIQTTPATSAATAAITVTVVVWESGDIYHYATATITLVNASTNPITFTGIHPTTIAAGGVLQDVWLDARNLLNTTTITFTDPLGNTTQVPSTNVFTIPITANYCTPSGTGVTPVVTCDASIMTRIRLTANQLTHAGTGQITVNNIPSVSGAASNVSIPIDLVYAKPSIVSAVPDSFPQGTSAQFTADGGYFGADGSLVELLFNGNLNLAVPPSNSRQVTGPLQGSQTNTPGLYPVSVAFEAQTTSPPAYTSAVTNVAVQPTFGPLNTEYFVPGTTTTPQHQIPGIYPPNLALPGNSTPSSMALNSTKGYAVITEQGTNSVQLINFVPSGSRFMPTLVTTAPVGNAPTGIAIDDQIDLSPIGYAGADLGIVVNSADSTLTLLALTANSINVIGSPISLSNLIQEPPGTTTPLPFSVGIDPGTHLAIVAFSNATLGFVVYVNPNPVPAGVTPPTCFNSSQTPPCAIASVSLTTGATPEVIMQPDAPLAYVTPGGLGGTSVVDLLQTNNTVAIAPSSQNGASCPAGTTTATIITDTANGLNEAFPGAVLIQGVTPSYFNGTYPVLTASTYTFTYELTCPTSGSSTATTGGGGSVTFGNPYYTFSTTSTAVGGAINPISRTFAFADPNANASSGSSIAPQIGFIRTLDLNVSSLSLTLNSCSNTAYPCNPTPSGAPEYGIRSVAWDPYTNVLIAYDPQQNFNLISLISPGGPTASGNSAAYRIMQAINTGQQGCYIPSGSDQCSVYGPMVYDPKTNLVLVANAGSNTLTYLDLDPGSSFKKVSIRDLQVTSGGVPSSQPPLASAPNAPTPLPVAVCDPTNPTNPYASCFPQSVTVGQSATVRILGQGFGSSGTSCNSAAGGDVVRLDSISTGITCTVVSDSEIDATISASQLTAPHNFSLDVVANGVNSNTQELYAVSIIDLSKTCSSADMPEGVAFDDERKVALVTNYGCNTVSIVNMDSTNAFNYGVPYGSVMSSVSVGPNPLGIATISRLGYAVVANNAEGSASVINIANPLTPATLSFTNTTSCTTSSGSVNSTNVCVGIAPTGVAIDQDRALAIVSNTGGNSISAIDLTALLASPVAYVAGTPLPMQLVATSGPPTAIAIDPNRAEAVVTNVQNSGTVSAVGGIDVITLSSTPPSRSTSASINTLTANPTGVVYDPAVSQPCASGAAICAPTLAPALFYVTSTQQNAIYVFDPDTGSANQVHVGVNPYSIGYNYQTGTLFTINSTSNTSSVLDTVNSGSGVFTTRETLGIGSQSQFAIAVDNFTSTAIIADQNNNRVLIMALPR